MIFHGPFSCEAHGEGRWRIANGRDEYIATGMGEAAARFIVGRLNAPEVAWMLYGTTEDGSIGLVHFTQNPAEVTALHIPLVLGPIE